MPTNNLHVSITQAFKYLDAQGIPIPPDILLSARLKGIKAGAVAGDLSSINKTYHDAITKALTDYFEGGSIASPRNALKRATVEAFGDAFDLGWTDGGQDLPPDEDALSWYNARVETEFGFIEQLFQQAKDLKKEDGFDSFTWTSERADGYTGTLRELYNAGRLRAMADQMVTFDGDDGAESCPDCQRLKGKRHKISWFIARDVVPPYGAGLECGRGGQCQHGLQNDKGDWITV